MNTMFSRLINEYPTYDALRTYLNSLGIVTNTKDGDSLAIFRYNREQCDLSNPITRAFRSVVWDTVKNMPVYVAPMKSTPDTELPAIFPPTFVVEEFLDGVMVNVFFDPYKQEWRITTRSRLDGYNKFYNYTFASLFKQAWSLMFPGVPEFSQLNKGYGYSFVLQHPMNRIVVPTPAPSIRCAEICSVDPLNGNVCFYATPATMLPPRRFMATTAAEAGHVLIPHIQQFEGIQCQGIVIRDLATGRRWKMRTPLYQSVRKMRGNHSRLEYVWFENLKTMNLENYLTYYPEERAAANATMIKWTQVVSEIYNYYVHVFKVRDMPKSAIPAQYKGMLFDLHGAYLTRLAPSKLSLTWAEHQKIMASQDLKRMVFLATFTPAVLNPEDV